MMGATMMRKPWKKHGSRRGIAAVEFGLWVPAIMLMLSGIIDFGWYISQSEIVMRAARDGSRAGAAQSVSANITSSAINTANSVVTGIGLAGCTPTAALTTAGIGGENLRVLTTTVVCPYTPLVGIVPGLGNTMEYSFTVFTDAQLN
jgi:Flp pilus assembly protein TadG